MSIESSKQTTKQIPALKSILKIESVTNRRTIKKKMSVRPTRSIFRVKSVRSKTLVGKVASQD